MRTDLCQASKKHVDEMVSGGRGVWIRGEMDPLGFIYFNPNDVKFLIVGWAAPTN